MKLCCLIHPVARCRDCKWKICEECGRDAFQKDSKIFPDHNQIADLHFKESGGCRCRCDALPFVTLPRSWCPC